MTFQVGFDKPNVFLWKELHWQPSAFQLDQFRTLQELLIYFNKKVNLTRLLVGEDYWVGQVFDCLWPFSSELNDPQKTRNFIDVGSGCGFPGLAVAISLPGTMITLVDSTIKKTTVLKKITTELGLTSRVNILTERVENTGHNLFHRGQFDFAMARAVANANVVAEYLVPLIKPSGEALLFKGQWSHHHERTLLDALVPLKAKIKQVQCRELPGNRGIRHLIRLGAVSPCPALFPRSIGVPTKKPLGVQALDNLL